MRVRRWFVRIAATIVALVVVYAGAAVILGAIPVNRDFRQTPGGTEIAVCSNGVHTDFVLPVRDAAVDWSRKFPPRDFAAAVDGFDHIGIGWGDLDFYRTTPRWRDFRFGTALHALLGLGPSALHVQYRPAPWPTDDCKSLAVDEAHYRALADYIQDSLEISAAGDAAIPADPGYGGNDLFYWAVGRFSLLRSCNVWVGEGLKAAGLPSGLWTPFSFLVLEHL
jgi:uncharacterized protein (TIGR02117 family)